MKLSTRARYALRMMSTIARQKNGNPVGLGFVAKTCQISRRYLEQMACALKAADLIRGVKGKGGGYKLTRPAKEIRIGEIIEATIGPINIVDCVHHPETCGKADTCECRPLYGYINRRINAVLHEVSLAELANQSWLEKAIDDEDIGGCNIDVND